MSFILEETWKFQFAFLLVLQLISLRAAGLGAAETGGRSRWVQGMAWAEHRLQGLVLAAR